MLFYLIKTLKFSSNIFFLLLTQEAQKRIEALHHNSTHNYSLNAIVFSRIVYIFKQEIAALLYFEKFHMFF